MLRSKSSASCAIFPDIRGTICYGHWVLRLVISFMRQGCDLSRALSSASRDISHETVGNLFRALDSASCDIFHETGLRFITSIGFCVL